MRKLFCGHVTTRRFKVCRPNLLPYNFGIFGRDEEIRDIVYNEIACIVPHAADTCEGEIYGD
ncbi:MAG: hypothetical protein WCC84_08285 [Candidatus Cybelea sp.]